MGTENKVFHDSLCEPYAGCNYRTYRKHCQGVKQRGNTEYA